jgi:hypothetical protein
MYFITTNISYFSSLWATEDGSWLPKQIGEDIVSVYGSHVQIVL